MSTEYSHSHTHNYHTLIVILPDVEEDLLSLDAALVLSNSILSIPYIVNKSLMTQSLMTQSLMTESLPTVLTLSH